MPYLVFTPSINHYVRLRNEEREELEEQQRHLHVGLDKLRDTVTHVKELHKSLTTKRSRLEAKNGEANEKLQQMVNDQEAASINIQVALVEQERFITQRQEIVKRDLADAEPTVLEAQSTISNIKRQHLQEVRAMANPQQRNRMIKHRGHTSIWWD